MNENKNPNSGKVRSLLIYLGIPIIVILIMTFVLSQSPKDTTSYSEVVGYFEKQEVTEFKVESSGSSTKIQMKLDDGKTINHKIMDWRTFWADVKDDIDISRGDVIASDSGVKPSMSNDFVLDVCWLRTSPLVCGKRYTIRHATQEVAGIVKEVEYKLDIDKQEKVYGIEQLTANDIARVHLKTAAPLVFDSYRDNRTMGSLIFIDGTNDTVGAGMIVESYD